LAKKIFILSAVVIKLTVALYNTNLKKQLPAHWGCLQRIKEMAGLKNILSENGGRRSNIDRRIISYDMYIPERRFGKERRNGADRRQKARSLKK
jgi:hypothetical protein